jgi:hypothetical protein
MSDDNTLDKERLFSLHVSIIISYILCAFIAPLWFIIIIVAIHRTLIVAADGCIISKMERKARNNPEYDFFTELTFRTTGKNITLEDSANIDLMLMIIVLFIAIIMHKKEFKYV